MFTKFCLDFFTGDLDQVNAVYGTRIPTEVAAGAFRCYDRVHQLMSADDGIYRAGSNAQCAPDAFLFPDNCEHGRCELPTFIIKCEGFAPQQVRERCNRLFTSRRRTIDRFTKGDGFCVRLAAWVTALRALCLGQLRIDQCDQGSRFGFEPITGDDEQQRGKCPKTCQY